jgi:hypothetical protein
MLIRFLPELIFALALSLLAAKAHAKSEPAVAEKLSCEFAIKDVMDETRVIRSGLVAVTLKPGNTKEIVKLYNQPYYLTLGKGRIKPHLVTISRMEANSEQHALASNFLVKQSVGVGKIYEACAGKARVDDYCMLDSSTVATIRCQRAN